MTPYYATQPFEEFVWHFDREIRDMVRAWYVHQSTIDLAALDMSRLLAPQWVLDCFARCEANPKETGGLAIIVDDKGHNRLHHVAPGGAAVPIDLRKTPVVVEVDGNGPRPLIPSCLHGFLRTSVPTETPMSLEEPCRW